MQQFTLPKGDRQPAIDKIARWLALLPKARKYRVEVVEDRASRSDQQNKFLWSVPYKLLSEFTGYEVDELHEYLLGLYFGQREKRVPRSANFPNGVKLVPCRTTTTNDMGQRDVLTWDAFSDYVAFIQRFGAEHSVFIPDPDPNWREQREDAA